MGVLDKFLDIMKLNDEEDYDDDEFFDDDELEEEYEERPARKNLFKKKELMMKNMKILLQTIHVIQNQQHVWIIK